MPIDIEDVTTTVHVEPSGGSGEGAQPTVESGPEALQRWQALAARSAELAARTSAWRFDD
ncbi:MAG: hypothetical protein EOP40_00810 [Rubrivivax sp.]|nr:MAG: hypothetical protein EOP40_00810 [Rubrivivax sp.]